MSATLSLLGAAGLIGSVRDWVHGIAWMRANVPWLVLLGAGILGFILTWRHPAWRRVTRGRRELTAKIGTLQDELARSEARHTELKAELDRMSAALNEAKAGLLNREERIAQLWQLYSFGGELPVMRELATPDLALINSRLHELKPSLNALMLESGKLWGFIRPAEGTAVAHLTTRVDVDERGNAIRLQQAFLRALSEDRDPRSYLAQFYDVYKTWREWIFRLAAMADVDFQFGHPEAMDQFERWRSAETEFLAELRKKMAMPQMQPARLVMEGADERRAQREASEAREA